MSVAPHLDRGQGPVVVLVHGVGAGPDSLRQIADLLAERFRVVVLPRPCGPGGEALSVEDQADRLAEALDALDADGVRLVGISGGATLGLALGIRHPEAVSGLVLHEPLVGAHAAGLNERFQGAAASAALGEEEAMIVVRSVMGSDAWSALGSAGRAASTAEARRWRGEIAAFAAFAPSAAQLAALAAVPLTVTVGGRSDADRRVAAGVLHDLSRAEVVEVPGAGNAPHLDSPGEYARVLLSVLAAPVGGPS